jgi:glycosyltransferase involved in cell wall biosynthesis
MTPESKKELVDMKLICVNGRFLGRKLTGVDRFAIELLRAWDDFYAKQDPAVAGITIEVLGPKDTATPQGLRHIAIRWVGQFQGQTWEQVDLPLAKGNSLLVSLCNTAPAFLSNQIVAIHDAATAAIPNAFSTKFRLWYRLLMPMLGWRAKVVLTVSQFSIGQLEKHFNIPKSKITVVSEGGEHILREPADENALDKFDLRKRPYVFAVSSMAGHKNFKLVLEALALLPDAPFDVAIAGGANSNVFGSAGDLQSTRVKWLGYVTDGELRSLYEGAMCFVFPSLYEGFGIPPLEAMHCGCPVLASTAASIPEVCGDAALYFDPLSPAELAAKLNQITTDAELRASLSKAGMVQAKKFSWEKGARQLLDICREFESPEK